MCMVGAVCNVYGRGYTNRDNSVCVCLCVCITQIVTAVCVYVYVSALHKS